VDDFGRGLGCLLYGLVWTAGLSFLGLVVLGSLILAGVL
jgi:hypothetical protein